MAATGAELHELVFTDREARPAQWQTRCGRTDVPLEQTTTPSPHGHYSVTCRSCLALAVPCPECKRPADVRCITLDTLQSSDLFHKARVMAGESATAHQGEN